VIINYFDVKAKLIGLFDGELDDEWGFLNESDKSINKIGYATSLTPEIIDEAAGYGVDFIITHHDAWDFVYGMKEKCKELLNKHNIIHTFVHLPLDDADFGTGSSLANALNLQNCQKAIPEGIYLCSVIGETQTPIAFEHFSKQLTNILQESIRAYQNNNNPVHKVCITTGGGNSTKDIKSAVDYKCDTYVTGEYNLYSQQYAEFAGINLLVGSHTNTEILGVHQMVKLLVADTDIDMIRLHEENY